MGIIFNIVTVKGNGNTVSTTAHVSNEAKFKLEAEAVQKYLEQNMGRTFTQVSGDKDGCIYKLKDDEESDSD